MSGSGDEVPGDVAAELDAVERDLAESRARIDQAELGVADVERRAALAIAQFEAAAATFDAAAAELERLRESEQGRAMLLAEAAESYAEAEQRYRWASYAIMALAWTAAAGRTACAGRMTTSQFRRMRGITDPGKHVDHIWPAARGGADHPVNYQVWPASRNMACGQNCLAAKFGDKPVGFVAAVAVSLLVKLGCP